MFQAEVTYADVYIIRIQIDTHNLLKCKHTVGINQMLIAGRRDFQLSMCIFITVSAFIW